MVPLIISLGRSPNHSSYVPQPTNALAGFISTNLGVRLIWAERLPILNWSMFHCLTQPLALSADERRHSRRVLVGRALGITVFAPIYRKALLIKRLRRNDSRTVDVISVNSSEQVRIVWDLLYGKGHNNSVPRNHS